MAMDDTIDALITQATSVKWTGIPHMVPCETIVHGTVTEGKLTLVHMINSRKAAYAAYLDTGGDNNSWMSIYNEFYDKEGEIRKITGDPKIQRLYDAAFGR